MAALDKARPNLPVKPLPKSRSTIAPGAAGDGDGSEEKTVKGGKAPGSTKAARPKVGIAFILNMYLNIFTVHVKRFLCTCCKIARVYFDLDKFAHYTRITVIPQVQDQRGDGYAKSKHFIDFVLAIFYYKLF